MARLNLIAAQSVFSALSFVALIPIVAFWVRSLKRVERIQSPPLRVAHLLARITPPVYGLGILLGGILGAYVAAAISNRSLQLTDVTVYLSLVASFLITAGAIGITLALYLSTIASLYVALGRTTWWKLLRLDAPVGGALLLVLDIAYFGRNVALVAGATRTRADRLGLLWLPLIIEITLLTVTVGAFCAVIYTKSKLRKRGDTHVAAMGKIPTLLLSASSVWTIRCCYNVASTIKSMLGDWTQDETDAQLILVPIFEYLIGAAVLALVTIVVLKPVWADASLQPTTSHPVPAMMGQYPGQGPQYQQHPGQYPQYQQPPAQYPQYGYSQQQAPYNSGAPVQQQPQVVYPSGNQQQPHVYAR